MSLQDIAFGKTLSHLCERFRSLEQELYEENFNLPPVFRELNKDPVYRFLQDFRLPVPECPKLTAFQKQIDKVEKAVHYRVKKLREDQDERVDKIGNAVKPFIATARNFIQSFHSHWDDNSYLIVPVYVTLADRSGRPGMVYLRRFNPDMQKYRAALWNIDGLTQDGTLLNFNRNYFNEIANVLMGIFYFTDYQRPHADPVQLRSDHVYKLLFNCEITRGKSHGGAILVLFAICYLYSVLGKNYLNYIAPSPGTMISATIEPDGSIGEVDHIEDKVKCVLEEYGKNITFIVPDKKHLPSNLEQNILPGHIHYVSTAEDLLEKALFSGDSSLTLDNVRGSLFKESGRPVLESIKVKLRNGVPWDEIRSRYIERSYHTTQYTKHPCGVLTRAERDNKHLFLQYGFEEAAFLEEEKQRELVFLILDGSSQMDAAWHKNKDTGFCLMTNLVFKVSERLDFQRCDLVCGFLSSLSSSSLLPINEGMLPEQLEAKLQKIRDEGNLRYRGAFLRPVCETIEATPYFNRTKRLYIITDSEVYDYDDTDDVSFSAREWFTLNSKKRTRGRIALCSGDSKLSDKVLDDHFAVSRDMFCRIVLNFGNLLPLAWEPEIGILERDSDGTRLNFEINDKLYFRAIIRLPGWSEMEQIKTTGQIVHQGETKDFEIQDFVVSGKCKTLKLAQSRYLSDKEFEQWQVFETPEWRCPMCNSLHARLLEIPELSLKETPVFKTLQKLKGGYILLQKGLKEWQFFKTGYELEDEEIIILGIKGIPNWTRPDGELREIPTHDAHYRLDVKEKVLYVLSV